MKRMLVAIAVVFVLVFAVPAMAAPDGKALYASKCAMCHGQDGVPKKTAEGSKAFNDPAFRKGATVEKIVKDTTDGVGKMKGIKSLKPEETKAIAEYIIAMPAAK
ncbi:MAG TPA: cytochrome c [Candidatus Sulfotelmatobacter sp.]|jgi:mono/diheme cytochrome c family protein|nr:cytochrome c [Candidatus Sulfotelmatobacter sp.]